MALYSPAQSPLVVASAYVNENGLPHASDAVAVAKTGVAGHMIVVGTGSAAITGAIISCTVTVCVTDAELPQTSVAVQIRVTVYSAGQSPGTVESLEDKVKGNPQASEAATENEGFAGQLMVAVGGMAITIGGVIS